MDALTLSQLFAATLSPDANVRKRAELDIRQVRNSWCISGYSLMLSHRSTQMLAL